MKETAVEKRATGPLKERAQYALAFAVIALMLYVAGFPLFLLFFVGVLTFFIWKVFSSERRNDTRRIFEFYLSANEILRDDDRKWYGFEIQETITRGEMILSTMSTAPPLVYFALGSLYQKLDDHASATKYLSAIEEKDEERKIIFPANELRDYVRVLRKIERSPAEAPLTSAAIRALERARKNRAHELLELSRAQIAASSPQLENAGEADKIRAGMHSVTDDESLDDDTKSANVRDANVVEISFTDDEKERSVKRRQKNSQHKTRKTISEVLHDIYDTNTN